MEITQIFSNSFLIEDEEDLVFCEGLINQNVIDDVQLKLNMAFNPVFINYEKINKQSANEIYQDIIEERLKNKVIPGENLELNTFLEKLRKPIK